MLDEPSSTVTISLAEYRELVTANQRAALAEAYKQMMQTQIKLFKTNQELAKAKKRLEAPRTEEPGPAVGPINEITEAAKELAKAKIRVSELQTRLCELQKAAEEED